MGNGRKGYDRYLHISSWKAFCLLWSFIIAIIWLPLIMPSGQVSRMALFDQIGMKNACQDVIAKVYTNVSMIVISLSSQSCTAQELGYLFYQRQDYVYAAHLYEEMLRNGISKTYVDVASYRWLSDCYEQLGLTESAEFYARRALEIGDEIMPALNIARRLEEKGDIDEAAGHFSLACTLYLAFQPLPKDSRD